MIVVTATAAPITAAARRASSAPAWPSPPIEPAVPIDSIDPAEPIDRIDPDDPIDRIEPAEPIDRIDPMDPIDRIDPIDTDERMLRIESNDLIERIELPDSVGGVASTRCDGDAPRWSDRFVMGAVSQGHGRASRRPGRGGDQGRVARAQPTQCPSIEAGPAR